MRDKNLTPMNQDTCEMLLYLWGAGLAILSALVCIGLGVLAGLAHV